MARRGPLQRAVRPLARLIEQRPPEVETRLRLGDWKGDLIVGRLSQSAIAIAPSSSAAAASHVCSTYRMPTTSNSTEPAMDLVLASVHADTR